MAKAVLEPYLFFNGNAREAMEFYKSVFGGELTFQTHGEAMGEHADAALKDKIIHARLEGDFVVMASDDMGTIPAESARVSLSVSGDDEAQMTEWFDKLAGSGGKVAHKLEKQFWGDTFGDLRDQFGISWMFNINAKKD